jgi:hypothetical protein
LGGKFEKSTGVGQRISRQDEGRGARIEGVIKKMGWIGLRRETVGKDVPLLSVDLNDQTKAKTEYRADYPIPKHSGNVLL